MAKKEQRFIKVMEDSGFVSSNEVLVDTQTGVQYLYHAVGNSGGLTLLVDAEGKPLLYRKTPNAPEFRIGGIAMIITTTPTVEGRRITEYKGIVFGEVIAGVNVVKDIAASFSNFFGGRSGTYENELINAREQAIHELEQRALQLNADAVVAVDVDYEVLGADNGMLMVTASGTAVRLD